MPPPMEHHTFNKVDNHRAVVFGGWIKGKRVNDTYLLDMQNWVLYSVTYCKNIAACIIIQAIVSIGFGWQHL